MNAYAEQMAEQRRARLARGKELNEQTAARARELGFVEGRWYDVEVRYEKRRGTRVSIATRHERRLRWDGRVDVGLIELYTPRPLPDGPEQSRFLDPADIVRIIDCGPIAAELERGPVVAGWQHSWVIARRPACDLPEPRSGAELLRASFCRHCQTPIRLVEP